MSNIFRCLLLTLTLCSSAFGQTNPASVSKPEALLGAGDIIRISVYQNPDLTMDSARISELGQVNFPLIGNVSIGGITVTAGEQKIATALRDGGFVLKPQVTILVAQIRSSVISILGQVAKPGRYPIETVGVKVSEMIATTGGVVPGGADIVTLVGTRNGQPIKFDIDLPAILQSGKSELDVAVENGDILYVDRSPNLYIYGEIQRPGMFRLERGMTLLQALAQAGGLNLRGTERGIKVHRRDAEGKITIIDLKMNELVARDDVIYVKESLF